MKPTTISVNGAPFTYQDEIDDITYDSIGEITEEQARDILVVTRDLFNAIGLSFYLAFGTLLGAVREHGLIPKDEDVDIFIDDEQTLYNNLPYLYEHGYKVCRISKGLFYSFKVGGAFYIDVYILRPFRFSIWGINCLCLSGAANPKRFFKEYQDIELFGETFQCPKDPEKILAYWYGDNWRTPVRGHKFYYEYKSAYYWHKKIKPEMVKLTKTLLNLFGIQYKRTKN